MKKVFLLGIVFIFLSGCAKATPSPTVQPTPTATATRVIPTATALPPTPTLAPTDTLVPTATLPSYPLEGRGPTTFEAGVDPLTGLEPSDPAILQRRPLVIKVENLPREDRPQYGLSKADLVYEYYTEQGSTRFAAVYYGQDAERVAPIRSGRFFDVNVVQMVKGVFVFGSAYSAVWNRFVSSDFGNRLIVENPNSCPALCRFEPNGRNFLAANTAKMNDYLKMAGINNAVQTLNGMFFNYTLPAGGQSADHVYVRYSGAIYNRWDWDATSGRYLRFSDAQDDVNRNNEKYTQLTDQQDNQPIAADTVVTLCVPHKYYYQSPEIEVVDIMPLPSSGPVTSCDGKAYEGGSGPAYVARDGQLFNVTWKRAQSGDLISLIGPDGQPFPYKPGQTWFEVIGASSSVKQDGSDWHFSFKIVP